MTVSTRISADEAHAARKDQFRVGPGGQEAMLKIASAPSTWNEKDRSARFVMTSQSKDRYGDIVVTNGLDTTEFEKNPQAFLNHRSGDWSIGQWANLKKMRSQPARMEGDLVLHKSGGPIPAVDQAAWMIENGYMRASSIGFLPDFNEIEKVLEGDGTWQGGLQFNKGELIECSLVGVPANTDALAKSIAADIGIAREILDYTLDHWALDAEGKAIERKSFEDIYRLVSKTASEDAGAEVERHLAAMSEDVSLALCERFIAAKGKVMISRDRSEAIERAARQQRLAAKRARDLEIIKSRAPDAAR